MKTPTRVLTANLTVLTKMHAKVSSVSVQMSYFHMFCFLPNETAPKCFKFQTKRRTENLRVPNGVF